MKKSTQNICRLWAATLCSPVAYSETYCSHTLLTWSRAPVGESCVGCGRPCPGLRAKIKGGRGDWEGGRWRNQWWPNSLESKWWSSSGGWVMAPRPLCHMAPSQVRGEACWPLTERWERDKKQNNVGMWCSRCLIWHDADTTDKSWFVT